MLNDKKIKQLSLDYKMVEPYDEELLNGNSIDVTLGNKIKLVTNRSCTIWDDYVDRDIDLDEEDFYLQFGTFALGSTIQFINLPCNSVGIICGKSSIARLGLIVESAGLIDSCWERGQITLELANLSPKPVKLTTGMKIAQIYFEYTDPPTIKPYNVVGHYNKQEGPTESVLKL